MKTHASELGTTVTALGGGGELFDVMVDEDTTGGLDDAAAVRGGVVRLALAEGDALGHCWFWIGMDTNEKDFQGVREGDQRDAASSEEWLVDCRAYMLEEETRQDPNSSASLFNVTIYHQRTHIRDSHVR